MLSAGVDVHTTWTNRPHANDQVRQRAAATGPLMTAFMRGAQSCFEQKDTDVQHQQKIHFVPGIQDKPQEDNIVSESKERQDAHRCISSDVKRSSDMSPRSEMLIDYMIRKLEKEKDPIDCTQNVSKRQRGKILTHYPKVRAK